MKDKTIFIPYNSEEEKENLIKVVQQMEDQYNSSKQDVSVINTKEQGKRFDEGKVKFSVLPMVALHQVMLVGAFGAKKYGDHNYRKGMPILKFIDAAFRHIFINWMLLGEESDDCPEKSNPDICPKDDKGQCTNHSGLPHLAHGAWNILAACEQMIVKPELDDRIKVK